MTTRQPYTSWDPRQTTATLANPLPPPWEAPGRVPMLFRTAPGVPASTLPAHATAAPMVFLERAIRAEVAVTTEALGHAGTDPRPMLRQHPRAVVLLCHGGPRAGDVQVARPEAGAAQADVRTNRSPTVLTVNGWRALEDAMLDESARMLAAGAWGVGLEVGRGQLFHAALSPVLGDAQSAAQGQLSVTHILRGMRAQTPRVAVSLTVEDVTVGGLSPLEGVRVAQWCVAAGATLVLVRSGGPHMPARLWPAPPRSAHEEGPSLHAAIWTRRALPRDVVVVPAGAWVGASTVERVLKGGLVDGVVAEEDFC